MTDRFPDANLDLSGLPAPPVIKTISYDAIKAARLADFAARMLAAGIPYNVQSTESDPGVILQEEDAYREMLDLQAINDAAKAVMLPFAYSGNQDVLFSLLGIRRLVLVPGDPPNNIPAIMESDADFQARAQIALEGTAPGLTGGGYASIALRASPEVKAVKLVRDRGGVVNVVLLGRLIGQGGTANDGSVSVAAVQAVAAALNDDWTDDPATGSQLTDIVQVMSAQPVPYSISARANVHPGPATSLIQAQSVAALTSAAASLQLIGETVTTDALIAAGRVATMQKFWLDAPAVDFVCTSFQVPHCTSITVAVNAVA